MIVDNGYKYYIDYDKEWDIKGTLIFSPDLECYIASSGRQLCNNENSYSLKLQSLKSIIWDDIEKIRKHHIPLSKDRMRKYLYIYNNFNFKQTPYQGLFNYLLLINSKFSAIKSNYNLNFQTLLSINSFCFTNQTLVQYNDMAYYLQKAGANKEAIFLLEKIIKKFPNRTVAYYNLGDAYWALGKKDKAIKAYTTYIEQMCDKGLQKKIPKEVLKRVEVK
jgi:tetratricopeptide (TPR) repeat protein